MITIENANILYGDEIDPIKANILIEDREIVEVSAKIKKGKVIDAAGCIVSPGFINSHVHLGDSVAMDFGDGKSVEEIVKPPNGIKHRILSNSPPSLIKDFIQKSMWDMLKTGTTTFLDFREGGKEGIEIINEAAENVPIHKIVLGRHDSFLDPHVDPSKIAEIVEELVGICDGIAPSGLGEINDSTADAICRTTRRLNKLSAIHVAEYQDVQDNSLKNTGQTEVQRAVEAGFKLLVHLTSPLKNDLELVAVNKIPVVCCPRSNGTLSAGIPPIREMFESGITLLLGTDNLMFNSPNMLREMEYALKTTRGYSRGYFSPREIIKMATVNAGKALKLNIGSIFEDKLADLVIAEQLSKNPYLSIINRTETNNIRNLIVEGQIIY